MEELHTTGDVSLTLDVAGEYNGTVAACHTDGRDIYVEFFRPTADVPLIETSDTGTSSISECTAGTKEYDECAGRGICDRTTGVCTCFPGYGSSGDQGIRAPWADCGYVPPVIE